MDILLDLFLGILLYFKWCLLNFFCWEFVPGTRNTRIKKNKTKLDFYIDLCGLAKITYLCRFKCRFFRFSTYKIMPFGNNDILINFFLILCTFFFALLQRKVSLFFIIRKCDAEHLGSEGILLKAFNSISPLKYWLVFGCIPFI